MLNLWYSIKTLSIFICLCVIIMHRVEFIGLNPTLFNFFFVFLCMYKWMYVILQEILALCNYLILFCVSCEFAIF
jgi:hypothetical protein